PVPPYRRKVVPVAEVGSRDWPRPLVFTNGVFDVIHRGHVEYLAAARELGAALLVAVNSDSSARQLGKGPGRPLNRDADRLLVVAALESVSFVTTFEETGLVRSWGGRSVAIPFIAGYSTSALVSRIRGSS